MAERNLLVHGPPGAGKTRTIQSLATTAAKQFGPESVGATSFTRAAGAELRTRLGLAFGVSDERRMRKLSPYIGTIHALCWQAIGRPEIVTAKHLQAFAHDINTDTNFRVLNPNSDFDPVMGDALQLAEVSPQMTDVELMATLLSGIRHRHPTWPHDGVALEAHIHELMPPEMPAGTSVDRLVRLAAQYEEWKLRKGVVDFEDVLERGRGWAPPVRVLVVDEAQDCQPPGTMVTTSTGRGRGLKYGVVPIEQVRVGDYVVSYNRKGLLMGRNRVDAVNVHPHNGPIIRVEAGGKTSRYTPEHHCVVKVGGAFKQKHVVYLMRRGELFRVGVSSPYHGKAGAGGSTGVKGRMLEEGGEESWILASFDDRRDAYVVENLVTAHYAIPQVRFKASGSPGDLGQDHVDRFWNLLGSNRRQAEACLAGFGRDIRYPLTNKQNWFLYNRAVVIRACNLMDGMTLLDADEVLQREGRRAHRVDSAWKPVKISREQYDGPVYSLSVEKHHTYVADGLVTHNCTPLLWSVIDEWAAHVHTLIVAGDPYQSIYLFAGADPRLFRDRSGDWLHLRDAHRFGNDAALFAKEILRRGGWSTPKDAEFHDSWQGVGDSPEDGSTFYLARTHSLLAPIEKRLQEQGTPYARLRGRAPLQTKAAQEYKELRRGERKALSKAVQTYFHLPYLERVWNAHGEEAFIRPPKIALSTVHGAKGREADEVHLVRSWGILPARNAREKPQDEALVAYVGASRHRKRLIFEEADGIPYNFPPVLQLARA